MNDKEMREAEQRKYEEWRNPLAGKHIAISESFEAGWQAAIAWMMAQAEPVYQVLNQEGYWGDHSKESSEMAKNHGCLTRTLYTAPVVQQETWKPLSDAQWMNIVNHDHAYESFSKDDAVHETIKRTEAALRELNDRPTLPSSSIGFMNIGAKETAERETVLPKWIDDKKGSDQFIDRLIYFIETNMRSGTIQEREIVMPELPCGFREVEDYPRIVEVFTIEQMEDYARSAVLLDRKSSL